MESPLDILSRAAGMVSSERLLKRKQNVPDVNDDEEQPLDMSCKKKRLSDSPNRKVSPPPVTINSVNLNHRPSVIVTTTSNVKKRHLQRSRHNSSSSSDESDHQHRKFVKRKRKYKSNNIEVEKSRRIVVITSKEDDIDEHFRRSLGENYKEIGVMKKEIVTTNSSKAVKPPPVDDEDGEPLSVDDHFAKALGSETWSRLSSSSSTSVPATATDT